MQCTLHIGMGKTGTSSIQNFLNTNYHKLIKQGIFYSLFLNTTPTNKLTQLGSEKIINLQDTELLNKKIKTLTEVFQKKKINHFIWSLESLFFSNINDIKQLKHLINYTNINIIIYLRRQDHWFESAYYQWGLKHKTFKGKYVMGFEQFYETRINNGLYNRFIDNWASVFGKENITIQPFEKEQLDNGLINNFCELANLNLLTLKKTEDHQYEKFDHYINELIGIYNSQHQSVYINQELISLLTNRIDHKKRQELFEDYALLSAEKKISIIKHFEESNQKIAHEYLNRPDRQLFYEQLPDLNEQKLAYEPSDQKHFLPIILELLMNQEKEIQKLRNSLKTK